MPDRTIAVLLKGYPRLSETFIAQELRGLEKAGMRLHLISMRHPTDTRRHPVHDEIEAPVTSLRTVQWDSFRVNFFVVAPPGVLDGFPATYVTSFHLPPERPEVLSELVRAFPSVTVLDMEAILSRVRHILERAALAVQYVFLFALLAGVTVLAAAVQSTLDERRFESAVLRTLGADRRRLLAGLLAEFATLGALAGLLASAAAAVTGVVLARAVFDLDYVPGPGVWFSGVGAESL